MLIVSFPFDPKHNIHGVLGQDAAQIVRFIPQVRRQLLSNICSVLLNWGKGKSLTLLCRDAASVAVRRLGLLLRKQRNQRRNSRQLLSSSHSSTGLELKSVSAVIIAGKPGGKKEVETRSNFKRGGR